MLSAHFNFDDIAGEFFRMLVFALVWGSYVLRSQNIREVFVRKYNERARVEAEREVNWKDLEEIN